MLKGPAGDRVHVNANPRILDSSAYFGDEKLTWSPPVDIYETDDRFVVNAELPGVESKDIRVEICETVLSISGERRFGQVCLTESYHRLEGIRGRFHRVFALPEALNNADTKAELKDGVLQVIIPKLVKSTKRPGAASSTS